MTTRSITTIEVAGQSVRHHCEHQEGRSSWILDGSPSFTYLDGTADDLDELALKIMAATAEHRRSKVEATMTPLTPVLDPEPTRVAVVPNRFAPTHSVPDGDAA